MSKGKYKIRNWSCYNEGLKRRGAITIWITAEFLKQWHYQGTQKRGGKRLYSDLAIEACLLVRQVYHLALRQAEGLIRSFFQSLSVELPVPHYTTLCRRCGKLHLAVKARKAKGSCDIVLDSTGLKLYGEGQWKVRQHGWSYHRRWRKLHVALNTQSQQAEAVVLSENALTDGWAVGPLLDQIPGVINYLTADG